jgi:hypothetical protein
MATTTLPPQPAKAAETTAPARPARPAARKKPATPSPAAQKRATTAKTVAAPVPEKEPKAKKPKLVRDSFTFPKDEYVAIEALKLRAAQLAHPAKKSEILRAGLKALTSMSDTALRSALQAVPAIKTGRPKSEK